MFSFSPRTQAVLLFLGIFALGLVCGTIVERKFLRSPGPSGDRGRPYDYNRMIERLSDDLALSDEQKSAVRTAFQEHRREIETMRRQIGEDMRSQEQKLREKLKTILTPEQFAKFEERNKRRGFRGRGGGRRGPPGDRPPGSRRGQ
jgi:Spy/CpxP family protein refolding chaperone